MLLIVSHENAGGEDGETAGDAPRGDIGEREYIGSKLSTVIGPQHQRVVRPRRAVCRVPIRGLESVSSHIVSFQQHADLKVVRS